MYCALSGEVPQEPVVSKVSGHLFEKRLITKSLEASNGVCPVTGAKCEVSDLLDVAADLAVRPRPLAATSLPAMLAMFQNEWDDLVVEAHATRQQLHATRKELSHALYQHDAACRVIARLVKERDEARAALGGGAAAPAAPAAEAPLDPAVTDHMTQFWKKTSKARKKRAAPPGLAAPAAIKAWGPKASAALFGGPVASLAVSPTSGAVLACGGAAGVAWAASFDTEPLRAADPAACGCFLAADGSAFATCAGDAITLWTAAKGALTKAGTIDAPSVASVAAHPTFAYLAAAAADGAWALVSCEDQKALGSAPGGGDERVTAPVAFHPDGLILATAVAGPRGATVRVWDVKERKPVHAFTGHSGPVACVCFSENGYHMASASADATVKVWDLRKLTELKTLAAPGPCAAVAFDFAGKYIAFASASGVAVRAVKEWAPLVDAGTEEPTSALAFAPDAQGLAVASARGALAVFAAP